VDLINATGEPVLKFAADSIVYEFPNDEVVTISDDIGEFILSSWRSLDCRR
jgi:hypothetical protein